MPPSFAERLTITLPLVPTTLPAMSCVTTVSGVVEHWLAPCVRPGGVMLNTDADPASICSVCIAGITEPDELTVTGSGAATRPTKRKSKPPSPDDTIDGGPPEQPPAPK